MGEVVQGPWGREDFNSTPSNKDDLVVTLADDLLDILLDGIYEAGFEIIDDDDHIKDIAIISEAIRSYLLKVQEKYSPMQDVASAYFDLDEESGALMVNHCVDVIFREEED